MDCVWYLATTKNNNLKYYLGHGYRCPRQVVYSGPSLIPNSVIWLLKLIYTIRAHVQLKNTKSSLLSESPPPPPPKKKKKEKVVLSIDEIQ